SKKKERRRYTTPLLYGERPKERPIFGDQRRRLAHLPLVPSPGNTVRRASGPGRSACSADCRRANQAIPWGLDRPWPCRRWGNALSSSEPQLLDLGVFGAVLPSPPHLLSDFAVVSAGLLVSVLPDASLVLAWSPLAESP